MRGARILVVDDDSAIRTVVGEALRREGYQVQAVGTIAAQALALEKFLPDLLITDVILPDGNGLDAVPGVLAKRPDLPIIVLSAQNTLTTAVRATEQGAFDYLPKPFDLDALCQAVGTRIPRAPTPRSP
jgi:two-component system nitrogen regulation response regulator GlnG